MPWLQFKLQVGQERAEQASAALEACGAVSVSLEDAADQPLFELAPDPAHSPLWRETNVVGLFPGESQAQDIDACMRLALGESKLAYQAEIVPDEDWERAYLAHYQPLHFGKLWICPSWQQPPQPGAINVILDPGLAFGTGTHASTGLCLEWLAQSACEHKTIVDFGCGSGILAIAALKLGAAIAYGTDIDPRALDVAQDNARLNQVEARFRLSLPEALPKITADIVFANILADPLVALAPTLAELVKPGGHIVLAGMLSHEADNVAAAYPGFSFTRAEREGWTMLAGVRNL